MNSKMLGVFLGAVLSYEDILNQKVRNSITGYKKDVPTSAERAQFKAKKRKQQLARKSRKRNR